MTAFFIATSKINNLEKFQQYGQQAGSSIGSYGGELVLKGKFEESLTTAKTGIHQAVGIISFPSLEKLNDWYQSDIYQGLIPLRDEAVDMTITTYSVPS
jgi:uncharacterized protein (DUF1330 family)